jgi:hypothetical protein
VAISEETAMATASTEQKHNQEDSTPLTIAVYQNGDHVSGILQQAYNRGLLLKDTQESGQQDAQTQSRRSRGELGIDAGGDVAFLARAAAKVGYSRERGTGEENRQDQRVVSSYEYTEAYYLHVVRRHLREQGLLRSVATLADANHLEIGSFVEFQASFRPNQITPFLDILTPDLLGRCFHYRRMSGAAAKLGAVEGFNGLEGFDRVKAFAEQARIQADADADLARAVATAVRADFRSEATREYYGTVGSDSDAVTAVTICDAACFLVDDADRLLDGHFTVLGKVSSKVAGDVPVLARNKLLNRLDTEFVDEAFRQLRTFTQKGAAQLPGDNEQALEKVLDASLDSRINGPSFNVIPVAIYL